MPRPKKATGMTSALQQVQKQARALLINLRKQIVAKEQELLHLKNEEASLGRLTGSGTTRTTRAAAPKALRYAPSATGLAGALGGSDALGRNWIARSGVPAATRCCIGRASIRRR